MPHQAHKYADAQQRWLNPLAKSVEPSQGDRGAARAFAQPDSIDENERTIRFVCSTNDIDRFGEVIEPAAFRRALDRFERNPVLLAGHMHVGVSGEPTTIGQWQALELSQNQLRGTAKFMTNDELAERYWQRYRQGVQRAVSVGFIVHEWQMREMEVDGETRKVRVFTEIELIEISAVSVPANQEALAKGSKMNPKTKGEQLGQRIRARREEREMTLADVAADLPIDQSTLGGIERGEIIRPPDNVLRAIADALDLDFSELQSLADRDQENQGANSVKLWRQNTPTQKQINDAVKTAIKNELADPDPDGPVGRLIETVAESVARHGVPGTSASAQAEGDGDPRKNPRHSQKKSGWG